MSALLEKLAFGGRWWMLPSGAKRFRCRRHRRGDLRLHRGPKPAWYSGMGRLWKAKGRRGPGVVRDYGGLDTSDARFGPWRAEGPLLYSPVTAGDSHLL